MRSVIAVLWVIVAAGCSPKPLETAGRGSTRPDGGASTLPGTPVVVTNVPIATIQVARPHAQVDKPSRYAIRSEKEWSEAWARLGALPPAFVIDYSTEMFLLVGLGYRGVPVQVVIARAAVDRDALRAEVLETRPGEHCVTILPVTYPVAVARLARYDGPVEFIDKVEYQDCR